MVAIIFSPTVRRSHTTFEVYNHTFLILSIIRCHFEYLLVKVILKYTVKTVLYYEIIMVLSNYSFSNIAIAILDLSL